MHTLHQPSTSLCRALLAGLLAVSCPSAECGGFKLPSLHLLLLAGTSIVRDSQLLALRLLYSIDYPVKYFILVVPRQAMQGRLT